jgi:hypothetical protein
VALIQAFNGVLTKQKEQKQILLQVVEKHRLEFPNPKKSTLTVKLQPHIQSFNNGLTNIPPSFKE